MPETCSSLLSVMGLWELWHRCFVLKRVSPESSFSFRFVKELNYILNLEALTNPKECQIGQLSGSFINWYNVFNTNSPEFLIWKNSCGKTRSRRLGFREESRCQSFFFSFSVFVSFLSAFISFLIMKLKKKKNLLIWCLQQWMGGEGRINIFTLCQSKLKNFRHLYHSAHSAWSL